MDLCGWTFTERNLQRLSFPVCCCSFTLACAGSWADNAVSVYWSVIHAANRAACSQAPDNQCHASQHKSNPNLNSFDKVCVGIFRFCLLSNLSCALAVPNISDIFIYILPIIIIIIVIIATRWLMDLKLVPGANRGSSGKSSSVRVARPFDSVITSAFCNMTDCS